MSSDSIRHSRFSAFARQARAFYALTKPRVVSLIVFTAVIGMLLASPGMVAPQLLLAGTVGIALVAGAAAGMNCLVEQKIDARMQRTSWRPLPRGELTALQTLVFAGAVGGLKGTSVHRTLYEVLGLLARYLPLFFGLRELRLPPVVSRVASGTRRPVRRCSLRLTTHTGISALLH